MTTTTCACCGFQFRVIERRDGFTRVGGNYCDVCYTHQSQTPEQTIKRHRDHEAIIRERLTASSEWAARVEAEIKENRQKVHWAYKSRDRAISLLRRLNDVHELHTNGSCSCGTTKDCKSATVLYGRWAQMMIKRVDDCEAEQRDQERRWRELHVTDFDGDDDELAWWGTPRPESGSSETA